MITAARVPGIGRRSLLAAAGSLIAAPAIAPAIVRAEGQQGVALVIGNSKYKWEASLPNVKRDAPDIAKRFQAMGLKTELVQDASQDAMRAAMDKFAGSARGANLAAFYFAGHGATWDKDTYLVPEDADLSNPSTVQSLLPVRNVNAAMKEAQNRLLVFDSCRNNPADGWRQRAAIASAGLGATDLAAAILNNPNTLVLYSTASGRVALDGPAGENSPFASALMRQLDAPSVDLVSLPAKLRRDLLMVTECRQLVWDQNTYRQPLVLSGSSLGPSSAPGKRAPAAPSSSAQIMEVNGAYAFARDKGLLLPPGLIAFRPPKESAHANKIGAFESTVKNSVGYTGGWSVEPALVVVMSILDDNSAEVVFASRGWDSITGIGGAVWRFVRASVSADRLDWIRDDVTYDLRWRDAASGVFAKVYKKADLKGGNLSSSVRFTRLD
jgi:hypothetical protein